MSMSQRTIAKLAQTSQATVSRTLSGTTQTRRDTVERISKVTGLPIEVLLKGDPKEIQAALAERN